MKHRNDLLTFSPYREKTEQDGALVSYLPNSNNNNSVTTVGSVGKLSPFPIPYRKYFHRV